MHLRRVLHELIEERLRQAVGAVLPDAPLGTVRVRPCPDPKFGDYQSSALMALAKERKLNPRQLATQVHEKLDVQEWCDAVEIAGAAFLNFRIKKSAVERTLAEAASGKHLFFKRTDSPKTIVVDFSSPNVAKPMHVGHIRSTILGDSLARTFRLLGHNVITDNHIGDWGTQFGILLVGWKQHLNREALQKEPMEELERVYKLVSSLAEQDPSVKDQARAELVKLQGGDSENLGIWKQMLALSQEQFETIYRRLNIHFDNALGESFYNPQLPRIVEDLVKAGIAQESEGAICVFSDNKQAPKQDPFLIQEDGEMIPKPAIIRKSDGGFNYMTTDLATLEHRMRTWNPDEIIYVTDARQQLHFQQLFSVFRRRWREATVRLEHVWFGSILGEDGRPFKTRSGETVKLSDLLDEAEERALKVVNEKNAELPAAQRREIARVVGIGAVKYADLLPNRQSDYVFSWDKLLAFNGNTAVYLLYGFARIRSIFRKGAIQPETLARFEGFTLTAPEEVLLAKQLLNFGIILEAVAEEFRPNFLCNYLYELSGFFNRFFEQCPVLKSDSPVRESRLILCNLTALVLQQGLEVLGVQTLEQM